MDIQTIKRRLHEQLSDIELQPDDTMADLAETAAALLRNLRGGESSHAQQRSWKLQSGKAKQAWGLNDEQVEFWVDQYNKLNTDIDRQALVEWLQAGAQLPAQSNLAVSAQ